MNRSTFLKLVDLIKPKLSYSNTNYRDCIAIEERVAVFLYKLGNNSSNHATAELFGIGESTVRKI